MRTLSERFYIFIVGLIIVASLYFEQEPIIYGLCAWLLLESIANFRVPKLLQKARQVSLSPDMRIPDKTHRFEFPAIRAWPGERRVRRADPVCSSWWSQCPGPTILLRGFLVRARSGLSMPVAGARDGSRNPWGNCSFPSFSLAPLERYANSPRGAEFHPPALT